MTLRIGSTNKLQLILKGVRALGFLETSGTNPFGIVSVTESGKTEPSCSLAQCCFEPVKICPQ